MSYDRTNAILGVTVLGALAGLSACRDKKRQYRK